MKTKQLKPGQEVVLPDGSTGIFVEVDKFGECRFITDGKDVYFFQEDLEGTWKLKKDTKKSPKPATKNS
jgi:uncharacterized cupin superfamily protein